MTGSKGDKGRSSVIDFSSPYYLHPSDSPKQPYVKEVLTDGNYNNWAREMTNFFFAKNKTDFVDGTLKKPETSSSEYKSWMRCDAMIKGWLTITMEKGIRDSVKYVNTSSEIWSDLKERFRKESAPRAYELKKKTTATRQEDSSVSTYYTRLRKKDDKAKPKAAYVKTGTSPIPGLNEGQYQEFVKFFSRSSNNVEAKPEANMAGNKDDGLHTRSLIRSGKCQGGLYLMDIFEKGRRDMMTTTDTWHKRLGHASRDKLSNVSFLKNNSSKLSNVFYDSCAKAKHVRNSFPKGIKRPHADTERVVHKETIGLLQVFNNEDPELTEARARGWYLARECTVHVCNSKDMFVDYEPLIGYVGVVGFRTVIFH
uniref:Putative reverse transcriptase, RNA-dependent DNA polymerase, Gag-polypeptide of LTR copia-type n=1 Tax=Tanacetum cinerariifolium TaxID=118510 RepID=A0A6L2LZX2_TANCI|nr:putative reverse transcriptase, RNA-dependent DNA polymerase, Gag-polypeptide of LTR copia-type [Tanacetum cinerariifolium]